jgi:hypothetical protein
VRGCYAGEAVLKDSRSELTANVKDARQCIPCDSTSTPDDIHKEYCRNQAIYFAVAGRCDLGPSDISSDAELQVCWRGFENAITNGTVQTYEIGIGKARGLTDLMAFRNVFRNTSVLIRATDLIPQAGLPAGFGKLAVGSPYYATVRLTNIAGVQVVYPATASTTPRAGPVPNQYSAASCLDRSSPVASEC